MIVDTHNDLLTEIKNNKTKTDYLKENQKYLRLLCCPVWTTELKEPMSDIERASEFLSGLHLSTELKLCVEDCWFLKPENVERLIKVKPFYTSFTWNNTTSLAGGCFDGGGLTSFGKDVMKEFEKNNIIVDTAHSNRQTFFDIANFTTKPLFNSHVACSELFSTPRNLNDEQLSEIINSNGYIAIFFVGSFLSSKGETTSADVAKHIDYVINKFGDDNIGLGTDFNGTTELPCDVKNYSEVENVFNRLKEYGYKDETIEKIKYRNFYEFYGRYMKN